MLLALILAQALPLGNPEGPIYNQPSLMSQLAFFEAYNRISTDWCSTAAGTGNGARGEALTYAGAGAKTCTKGVDGLRSTSIADGDLVSLTALPRVEADADGYLGLLVEGAASPITIQSRPICNAAWADVGATVLCAADATTGPWGTTTMARLSDADGAVKEGRSQTMATTSATRFTAYCYVKADGIDQASLTLAGTGNGAGDCSATITGLSGTTSSIISCTSAVAYTAAVTAVTVSVLVGDAVGDTGSIFVEGCNVVPSATYRTSFTDAAAVTVARVGEAADFLVGGTWASGCMAASVEYLGAGADKGWLALNAASFRTMLYEGPLGNAVNLYVNGVSRVATTTTPGQRRLAGYWGAAGVGVSSGGAFTTAAGVAEVGGPTRLSLLTYGTGVGADPTRVQNGIISRVVVDQNPAHPRCSP